MQLDYQQIIDIVAVMMGSALPIGIIIGLTEKICNLFFSIAFGKEKINL